MNLFKRKTKKPSIAYVHIELNLTQIRNYITNSSEINAGESWSNDDESISHTINILLNDDLYFHKSMNEFSHTIESSLFLGDDIGHLEWKIIDGYFFVLLTDTDNGLLFCCPLNEVRDLIDTGETKIKNALKEFKDGEIIELQDPFGYCSKIHRRIWLSYGIIYSNDLVRFDFSIPSASHFVVYK